MNLNRIYEVSEAQYRAILKSQYRRWWWRRHWLIVAVSALYLGWLGWIWAVWIARANG